MTATIQVIAVLVAVVASTMLYLEALHSRYRGWLLRAVLHEARSRLPESLVKEIEEELGG